MTDQPHTGARRVVAYLLSTLDGVMQAPGDWVFDCFDDEMTEHLRRVIAPQDAVFLGRKTYDEWKKTWPHSTRDPFASFINRTPKYIASRTLRDTEWGVAHVVRDVAAKLDLLRAEPGGEIGIHGSIHLVRALFPIGLIDEIKLVVMPVLAGAGEQLLGERDGLTRLTLLGAEVTGKGLLVLRYRLRDDATATAGER